MKVEALGYLKTRDAGAKKAGQLFVAEGTSFLQHDRCTGHLAKSLVRDAIDRNFVDFGVFADGIFDLRAANIFATAYHYVFRAIQNDKEAELVQHADVATVEPAVFDDLGGGLGVVPVALHHGWALNADLAYLAVL